MGDDNARQDRSAASGGFTLLEMLVALTVLGF
jgi:prepilin-type N-terminal cleavage/methylation domain-containing protein